MELLNLVQDLISLPGPPGQEQAVREYLSHYLNRIGYQSITDEKGNLKVVIEGDPDLPSVLVTAHMDEIALMITKMEDNGIIRIASLGGAYPWKWGESPVRILTSTGQLDAILSFGSIHTNHPSSVAELAREKPLEWKHAHLFTGMNKQELEAAGIRPGLRVILAPSRRQLTVLKNHITGPFLDDRADVAAMLLAMEEIKKSPIKNAGKITFLATVSEEVGGEGARFHLVREPAEICIALEIGPTTPDAVFEIDENPTIWVRDAYAAMESRDADMLAACCKDIGIEPHWQYLSRGGSDASCTAAQGLCGRPITLGLPVENSHGFEIIHKEAIHKLATLLVHTLRTCATSK